MRISTGMVFDRGVNSMQQRTSSLLRTQQQISSGRRMLTPSDDPVAAARSLEVTQSQEINKQYQKVQGTAEDILGTMDGQLSSMTDVLTRIRELTVQGGNGALTAANRASIATELRARFDELVALGNSTDGTGQYLFSGYQGSNKPFAGSVDGGVAYGGDAGQRTLSVSGSRDLPINSSGADLLMQIKNGNGVFATGIQSAKSANQHGVSINSGTVTNATLWNAPSNPANVEVRFWVDSAGGGVTTKGYAVGGSTFASVAAAAPVTIDSLAVPPLNNQFNLSLDGGITTSPVTVPDGSYTTSAALAAAVQSGIDTALGVASPAAGSATVSLDSAQRLVVTSNRTPVGTGSSVTLSAVAGGNTGFADLFGTPAQTSGLTSVAGQAFYDLVDAATGVSLFTGAASTAAAGGTYTHAYSSGATIPLSSAGAAASSVFDLGATVSVSGFPANGDKFSVARVNGGIATSPATITHTNAVIDRGTVTSPTKWSQAANSGNLELRFWTDPAGGAATAGRATGSVDLGALAYSPTVAGADDQFQIALNGNAAVTVTIPPGGPYGATTVVGAVQSAIDTALGAGRATVSLDAATNHLVVASTTQGAGSSIAVSAAGANTGFATLFDAGGGVTTVAGASTGGVQTPGYAVAAASANYPLTIGAAPNNDFQLALNLGAGVTIALTPGSYATPTALKNEVQSRIDASALGAGLATVSLDSSNRLVIASAQTGPTAQVSLSATAGTGFAAAFGGGATSTPGTVSAAGNVYYDLVDAATGNSAFTGTASNPAASSAGGTYTHRFLSGSHIFLSSPLSPAFDFGAAVTVTGNPATGDTFTLKDSTDPVLGNGYFVTAAKSASAANTGSGIIGAGEVLDQAKWDSPANSRQLEVRFWKDPTNTSANAPVYYDLVDARSELSLLSNTISRSGGAGNTFTRVFKSGDPIAFSGLAAPYNDFGVTATIGGTPASGDVFTLNSSGAQSIFETLSNTIHALEAPVGPPGSRSNAELLNKLGFTLTSLSATGDNVSRVRAEIGTHMGEVDDLGSVSQNLDLQYATTLSGLQDLDYTKAITDLTKLQMELQAAQQSFAKVSNLSLFNYL